MPKRVSIYQRAGAVYVIASHQTQAGFWIDDENVVTLAVPQSADVGSAIEAALACSRKGEATPPASTDLSIPLLAAAGVASWNTFVKTAKYVGVRQNGDTIKVTPYKNLGGKDGFEPMQDKVTILQSGDLGLAATVVRALEMAE